MVWFVVVCVCILMFILYIYFVCVCMLFMCLAAVFVSYCVMMYFRLMCPDVCCGFLFNVFVWFVCDSLCDVVWTLFLLCVVALCLCVAF